MENQKRRWGLKRATIAVCVTAITIIVTYWAVIELEPFRHEAISFETLPTCPDTAGKKSAGIAVTSNWANGTLTVRTSVCTVCGDRVEVVTAQVFGERVLLNIRTARGDYRKACKCQQTLIVRLERLPQADYQIMGAPTYKYC